MFLLLLCLLFCLFVSSTKIAVNWMSKCTQIYYLPRLSYYIQETTFVKHDNKYMIALSKWSNTRNTLISESFVILIDIFVIFSYNFSVSKNFRNALIIAMRVISSWLMSSWSYLLFIWPNRKLIQSKTISHLLFKKIKNATPSWSSCFIPNNKTSIILLISYCCNF